MLRIVVVTTLLSLTTATKGRADPCEGRLPTRHGEAFARTVRYVGDCDSLYAGRASDPDERIEVRLADFDALKSRTTGRRSQDILTRLTRGRQVDCIATRGRSGRVVSQDRVIPTYRLGGQRLGDLLRAQRRAPQVGD